MTLLEQRTKLGKLIKTGQRLLSRNNTQTSAVLSRTKMPFSQTEFEAWMGQINTFNSRYLKEHPQNSTIGLKFFLRKPQLSCCEEMIGILQAVFDDEEFWNKNDCVISASQPKPIQQEKNKTKSMQPIIFISHSSTDKPIADMLKDYLVGTGIPNAYIFCSSLPGNDVNQNIPSEIKGKLKNSTINIAILSRDYYESAYCLNEAGIIWFQESTPSIIIGLPEVTPETMYGFINRDNKLRRLDNSDDIAAIYDLVRMHVKETQSTMTTLNAASKKLIERYTAYLAQRTSSITATQALPSTNATLDQFTTDDEKILLYHIVSTQKRTITKSVFSKWLIQNELYGISIENAFDLLSSSGYGHLTIDSLVLDVTFFKSCTTNCELILKELQPLFDKHQQLSSQKFASMWKKDIFSDTDKLFIAYIIQNRITVLGDNWRSEQQIAEIRLWEERNLLAGCLSNNYSTCLSLFVENNLVFESDWTSTGKARQYTLCASLQAMLIDNKFEHISELEAVMAKNKADFPF